MIGSLLAVGCNNKRTFDQIHAEAYSTGTLTDPHCKRLGELANRDNNIATFFLNGLTSVTDEQADILGKVVLKTKCPTAFANYNRLTGGEPEQGYVSELR